MSASIKPDTSARVNTLIAPVKQENFKLPDGIVLDGADLVPTVQYLI